MVVLSRRAVLTLTIAGAGGLACGGFATILSVVTVCYDECPPESALASALAERFVNAASTLVPGLLPLLAAWVLSLVAFARARRWLWAAAVLLSLPLAAALALLTVTRAADGHLVPVTWYQNAQWGPSLSTALLTLMLWPLVLLLTSFALPRPISPPHHP